MTNYFKSMFAKIPTVIEILERNEMRLLASYKVSKVLNCQTIDFTDFTDFTDSAEGCLLIHEKMP